MGGKISYWIVFLSPAWSSDDMKANLRSILPFSQSLWMRIFFSLLSALSLQPTTLSYSKEAQTPRLNIPFVDGSLGKRRRESAIFWFGQVGPMENYADVRVSYNQNSLLVGVVVFDRLLWYDPSPSPNDLTAWDSVSIYLATNNDRGLAPDNGTYRFDAQLNQQVPLGEAYRATYRGTGQDWRAFTIPFSGTVEHRSGALPIFNDNKDDHGWMVTFEIPFSSFGLSAPPSQGTFWGLSVRIHDRDDAAGTPIPDEIWPANASASQPFTWGQMVFGLPQYVPPLASLKGSASVRQGLNGANVVDGMVGGNSNCGDKIEFWNEWGEARYFHAPQVNVQSQWDVADQPCFSKYYISFPLDSLPKGRAILSATLTLYQFGNSDPSASLPSIIQVFTVDQDWSSDTLDWNNAPQMLENISQLRVDPLAGYPGLPGVPRTWDVSLAAAQAYQAGTPLSLVFYEADAAQHSGKYFYSSAVDKYMFSSRPLLKVQWGDLAGR